MRDIFCILQAWSRTIDYGQFFFVTAPIVNNIFLEITIQQNARTFAVSSATKFS